MENVGGAGMESRLGVEVESGEEVEVGKRGSKKSRPRRWTVEEKRAMVEEALQPGVTVVGVAAAHRVNPDQLFHWRKQYRHGMLEVSRSPRLLAVTVSDRGAAGKSLPARLATDSKIASPSGDSVGGGTIHVELRQGQLRIAGQADPAVLRVVLECLLG